MMRALSRGVSKTSAPDGDCPMRLAVRLTELRSVPALGLLALLFALAAPEARAIECGCSLCDFDGDGDVDLDDFAHVQACLTDVGVDPTDPACLDADLDPGEGIVRGDMAVLLACMSGEGVPYAGGDLPDVLITEFMASNDNTLPDEDGDHPDWIEIHNPCRPVVNLEGWHLTDDAGDLTKWRFPRVLLGRGDFLVVFASDKDRSVEGGELHTNFKLSSEGEYLALVAADGQTIVYEFSPVYPEQLTDVSYGLAQSTKTLVPSGAEVRYHVPDQGDAGLGLDWADLDFPDDGWSLGRTGLGFSDLSAAGFEVTYIKSTVWLDNLSVAEAVIDDPSRQGDVVTEAASLIDYYNTGQSRGNFGHDNPFPNTTIGVDAENFIILATATVLIPEAGAWTFGVNSDDGYRLRLSRGGHLFESSWPSPRAASDTLET